MSCRHAQHTQHDDEIDAPAPGTMDEEGADEGAGASEDAGVAPPPPTRSATHTNIGQAANAEPNTTQGATTGAAAFRTPQQVLALRRADQLAAVKNQMAEELQRRLRVNVYTSEGATNFVELAHFNVPVTASEARELVALVRQAGWRVIESQNLFTRGRDHVILFPLEM